MSKQKSNTSPNAKTILVIILVVGLFLIMVGALMGFQIEPTDEALHQEKVSNYISTIGLLLIVVSVPYYLNGRKK